MKWISDSITQLNKWRRTKSYSIVKWLFLLSIAVLAIQLFDLEEVYQNILQLSFSSILTTLGLLALARLAYNLRLYLLLSGLNLHNLPFLLIVRTNLLGEFVSIVMPSYLGGDGTRWMKLEKYVDQPGTMATAILLDRIIGLASLVLAMAAVSWNIGDLLNFSVPVVNLILVATAVGGIIAGIVVMRVKFVRSWVIDKVISKGIKPLNIIGAVLLSVFGHMLFAISYYVLLNDLVSVEFLPVISIALVALTTRIIPISLLGIEATDGSFIALANLAGINHETAVVVVIAMIASRYFFASLGILFEMLIAGRASLDLIRQKPPRDGSTPHQ